MWSDSMAPPSLEERVTTLEETVAQLLSQVAIVVGKKDWRSTLGMFAGDAMMQEIDEEGCRIRQADREQVEL
jgi:hypothetical protein